MASSIFYTCWPHGIKTPLRAPQSESVVPTWHCQGTLPYGVRERHSERGWEREWLSERGRKREGLVLSDPGLEDCSTQCPVPFKGQLPPLPQLNPTGTGSQVGPSFCSDTDGFQKNYIWKAFDRCTTAVALNLSLTRTSICLLEKSKDLADFIC